MPDFWPSCGYRLLAPTLAGRLLLTDDFLRESLLRPELAPLVESGAAEIALHERLLDSPRRVVSDEEVAAIEDADARENYLIWRRFRDRLLAAEDIESAYVALFRGQGVDVPPLFVDQLTQVVLRHILGEAADPFEARTAEMLFRPQRIKLTADGPALAADLRFVERFATTGGFGSLGELLVQQGTPMRTIDLDVLSEDNAGAYWARSELFDFAVALNRGGRALDALCRVLERWIAHFLAVEVSIRPRRNIEDERWVWHVGLDAEASAILNDLYNGTSVDDDRMGRFVCLFELRFADAGDMRPAIAGRRVYLAMAVDREKRLRLKPQNLLLNLPLARPQ